MPQAAETCAAHAELVAAVNAQSSVLTDNNRAMEKLADSIGKMVAQGASSTQRLDHIAETIGELKDANKEQWSAINAVRARVYTGVGIGLSLSLFATVWATLGGRIG